MSMFEPQEGAESLLIQKEIIDNVLSLVYLVFLSDGSLACVVIKSRSL